MEEDLFQGWRDCPEVGLLQEQEDLLAERPLEEAPLLDPFPGLPFALGASSLPVLVQTLQALEGDSLFVWVQEAGKNARDPPHVPEGTLHPLVEEPQD
eukprot:7444832-Lingulodinium_polyedra.AAC.1